MIRIINNIAQRCHTTATKRGKDVSCIGCLSGLINECNEYWAAVDAGRRAKLNDIFAAKHTEDNGDFVRLYSQHVHNTTLDELADVIITAATWMHAARIADGDSFNAERSADVMLANTGLHFVIGQVKGEEEARILREVVNLKMRYNDLRL